MKHSKIYDRAVRYYEAGLWPEPYIRALTKAGKLTPTEYEEITGNRWT